MNAQTSNTMKWLLKREYWEHRGGFVWAPVIVGSIMSFFVIATLVAVLVFGAKNGMEINGEHITSLSEAMTDQERADFGNGLATGYMGTTVPLFGVMALVVFFFSLASLYDERKDRSVLFWKSLPVSDFATVLSKLAMALVVAPVITLAVASATAALIALAIATAAALSGVNLFGILLTTPDFYLAPLKLLALVPVYALWALPTVGWLMLVSAWARTKPFLWAVGMPVLAVGLVSWFNELFDMNWNVKWLWTEVVVRGLASVLPGTWMPYLNAIHPINFDPDGSHIGQMVTESWLALTLPTLWIGVVLGTAMIYAAIRLRRYRDEG